MILQNSLLDLNSMSSLILKAVTQKSAIEDLNNLVIQDIGMFPLTDLDMN